ncbi:hypothetical protein A3D00_04540 [Candidatus Woesebacteria bacterium RIFCSPHIGHO2_02_FULL_38_9]|uniref:Antitoxin n=1 Tax=Candidatus Woesebacteria bacterium RIFCSPHIGHO2_01_FULL_39_28 TaxID=1802496 RepID=A0A1F7YL18_9BACT|nr:MAG: hypothetical protein A2627_00360 [Candidatus Woesebacteria bacterium RIFCSPHIGHO2_01_FULL_39_28]OGM31895.1 MAG: hypothetical protein A3D00_04540 [Candidatus Woesebacteria bacterium RIFCSPHIGHO2_02_FULL_38_9]OGM56735.1 MAG: hypothetical protein A3A50_05260 [Candidatus Woesebacteria bacterium RIFCSPLOWO2_01_FULL_38_20]
MNLITTTDLRTKTSELVELLLAGRSVNIIHRSRVIGEIRPKIEEVKVFDAKRFKKIVEKLDFPHLTDKEIEKKYREAMTTKHGKGVL